MRIGLVFARDKDHLVFAPMEIVPDNNLITKLTVPAGRFRYQERGIPFELERDDITLRILGTWSISMLRWPFPDCILCS
ncbi:hypothetical protein M378DRAFT_173027 [Amanita muscaria Koide BX008]|uniref:Uncharacterized protein n=1 Tax=Amanita muscaria (strain Koide BX008) TaxID=946122 RepID=A0A0C2SQ00_AMAMK|nr:hypothetical protein M378DRAFT_173027 [Amanita muscaria Koide BX008]